MSATASRHDVRWLLRRLRRMTPGEIVLVRAPRGVRAAAERVAIRLSGNAAGTRRGESGPGAERLLRSDLLFDGAGDRVVRSLDGATRDAILDESEDLARGRFRLFGETVDVGPSIDWNRDPRTGALWPSDAPATSIDYRPESRPADPKDVWELGRHQHLVRLAIAFRLEGDRRHADAVYRSIDSFLGQCRPGRGIHETSALEMARRAQSWILAFAFLSRDAAARAPHLARRAAGELLRVGGVLRRRLSLYSSANNHLVGELSGLALLALLFEPVLPRTARWRRAAVRLLDRAAARLVLPDGSGAERSPAYLAYVVDDLAAVECALAREALAVPNGLRAARRRGRAFLDSLDAAFRPGPFPRFGDEDGGFAFGLPPGGPGGLLSALAIAPSDAASEPAPMSSGSSSTSTFSDSGLVLHRFSSGGGAVSLLFDAGSLGFPPLFGHGHADALSIALSVGGSPLLVDPGTYSYYRGEKWRRFFRGTASHATLSIGDRDQSEQASAFLWESDVPARLLFARATGGDRFEAAGEHDGYRRLPGSPVVRREVTAERRSGGTTIRIVDSVAAAGTEPPEVAIAFPFDAALDVVADPARREARTRVSGCDVVLSGPDCKNLSMRVARGEDGLGVVAGWQSRAFSRLEPSPTVLFSGAGRGPFVTTIRIGGR